MYRVRREVGRMGCYVGRVRENHESGVLANYGRMRSSGGDRGAGGLVDRFVTLVLLVSQSDVSQSDTPHRPPHTPFEMPFTTNSVL